MMLSRAEIEERLMALGGDLSQRDDAVWACVRREREALETAKWLGERLELCIVNEEYQTPQEWSKRDEARAWLEGRE
jgi:hypothetical protein